MSWAVLPAAEAVVLILLYRRKKLKKSIFLLLLLLTAAGFALTASGQAAGERTKIVSLDRETLESEGSVPLEVETDSGETYEVDITAPERHYTEAETEEIFDRTEEKLDSVILGRNTSFDRIEWNLNLVRKADGLPASVEWYSDRPELIDFEGMIHPGAPDNGTKVTLSADLVLQDKTRTYTRELKVFPPKEAESIREEIVEETEKLNENSASENARYELPSGAGGRKLVWYRKNSDQGKILCVLTLICVLLGVLSEKEKEKQERTKRAEQMEQDYPEIVSKMQLYLCAGLSMRAIFARLGGDYRKRLKNGGRRRVAFDELCRSAYRMANGVTEIDAYDEFGRRCGVPCYRSLALMLTQNLKKGGAGLLPLFEREVQTAFETRKRRARADGEKITVKLLLPLFMELGVVIALIMIPALKSF